jgi:hypothetical protein
VAGNPPDWSPRRRARFHFAPYIFTKDHSAADSQQADIRRVEGFAMKPSDTPPPEGEPLPSQGVRTIVSFLIFVHLFALAVCVLSTPRDGMSSSLQRQLRNARFLTAYMQWLWMDNAYDYFHTYGDLEVVDRFGTDHQFEIELKMPDGSARNIAFPEAGLFPRQRRQRLRQLANSAALTVGQPGESLLPAALLEHALRATGADSGTLRLRQHRLQTMEQRGSADKTVRDPYDDRYYRTAYTGYGRLIDGQLVYQKLESAVDSAPAAAPGVQGPAAPPPR